MRVWSAGAAADWPPGLVSAALVETDGLEVFALGTGRARPWSAAETDELEGPGREAALEMALGKALEGLHGWTIAGLLPPSGAVLNGAMMAEALGRDLAWDFDAVDRAMGGLGGAEDAFFHHALLRYLGFEAPAAVLDLGEVARLTWADPRLPDPTAPGACLAFDAGPGVDPDEAGAAEVGSLPEGVIESALGGQFFSRIPPRRYVPSAAIAALTRDLPIEDAAATRAALAAAALVQGLDLCPQPPVTILVCGPGRHHTPALQMIAAGADVPVYRFEEQELDGDLTRAQAAAYLAVRATAGLPTSAPGTTGVATAVGGAELAQPQAGAAGPH